MSLRLTTLGSPRVYSGDGELTDLPAQRLRFALLAYLAVEGEASRESVLSLFWPDRDAPKARHALRQMLYELRQLLGEEWVEVSRDRIIVHADVDAIEFEKAAAAQRDSDALALYGGAFLEGFVLENRAFEGWIDRRRAQLGRTHRRLRREHIDALLAGGTVDAALQVAQQWVELDPLEDEASHALIRCLALAGDRLGALQYYESYERQLQAELQVEPLDETRELVERIRSGQFAAEIPLPGAEAAAPADAAVEPASAPETVSSRLPLVSAAPADAVPTRPAERRSVAANATAGAATRDGSAAAASAASGFGGDASAAGVASEQRIIPRRREWLSRAAVAAVMMVVLVAGVVGYRTERPRVDRGTPVARVMVLPFTARTAEDGMAPLAIAMTDALARNLAQSRPLDVVSPAGVALLRERGVSEDSLRTLMQADYLVSGSISSDPDGLRVSVELLDGRTGSLLRSEVITRAHGESRILVDDVVGRTTIFLRRELGNQVEVRRVRAQTGNEEAWRAVLESHALQGSLLRLVRYQDREGIARVMDQSDSLLTRAAELDRRWAEPLIMRAWLMERRATVSVLTARSDTASRRKLLEAARSMADRATERDPQDARAYEVRGTALHQLALLPGTAPDTVRVRLALAEEQLTRATQLDPGSASSWRRLAELLNAQGRYAAAKSAAERAYGIDRFLAEASSIVNLLFSTSLELGEDLEAQRWCDEGRTVFANQLPFVYCLFALHAWADRIRPDVPLLQQELTEYRANMPLQPELLARFETLLAAAYARAGQQDSARTVLQRAAAVQTDPALLWLRAGALARLGDDDAALRLLQTYVAGGSWDAQRVAQSRPFWRYRTNPEYQQVVGSR